MLKLLCAPVMIAAMMTRAAFTAGVVAGVGGTIGIAALARCCGCGKCRQAGTTASPPPEMV